MEDLPLVDFTKVKKKRSLQQQQTIINKFTETSELDDFVIKKGPKKEVANKNTANSLQNEVEMGISEDDQGYSYNFLLDRITNLIKKHNPNMTENVRGTIKIPPPNIVKAGSIRSAWTNFTEVCTALNRPTEHLFQFILAELGVEGSLGGESQFILRGRYNSKHVQSLLKKYVHDYIQCLNCKSSSTVLKKDNSARLQVLSCFACGSERTVAPIKANVRTSRR